MDGEAEAIPIYRPRFRSTMALLAQQRTRVEASGKPAPLAWGRPFALLSGSPALRLGSSTENIEQKSGPNAIKAAIRQVSYSCKELVSGSPSRSRQTPYISYRCRLLGLKKMDPVACEGSRHYRFMILPFFAIAWIIIDANQETI